MPAIADQSTSELRANLLARRQWAKKVTGWRRRDALREIGEIEDELKARGEKLEGPEPGQAGPSRGGRRHETLQRVAVFSRNHRAYLDEAVRIGAQSPNDEIVFRARAKWATADKAVSRSGVIPIYYSAVGSEGQVEYAAELCGVLINPVEGSPEESRWLSRVLPATASEGLWNPPARTLYEIRNCRALAQPFPITRLAKASDGKPISADYGYSYCVVRAVDDIG
jgi:hypothetical protein